jgi:hypothetical protein
MRWAAEYARLDVAENAAMQLIRVAHYAQQNRVIAAGAGGARYHHIAPEQQQANAVASALVNRIFGPQPGQLHGTFGPLFREQEIFPPDTFGRRAVAFAAFHREDLDDLAQREGIDVRRYVTPVDPNADAWWTALLADEQFNRLRSAAPVTLPTAAETSAAAGAATGLWQTTTDLYGRAERRALEVLR